MFFCCTILYIYIYNILYMMGFSCNSYLTSNKNLCFESFGFEALSKKKLTKSFKYTSVLRAQIPPSLQKFSQLKFSPKQIKYLLSSVKNTYLKRFENIISNSYKKRKIEHEIEYVSGNIISGGAFKSLSVYIYFSIF